MRRAATINTCRVCAPLGAVLAYRGVAGCVPLVHGSQGCATYIRRYLISHFRDPFDVASTSFDEGATIFGGRSNLREAIANLARAYRPSVIGVCSTCLAETIGEDTRAILEELARDPSLPPTVFCATPSFAGCQHRGFHEAVEALLARFAQLGERHSGIVILPGPACPADLRWLRQLASAIQRELLLVPDYSDPIDGPSLAQYQPIPEGGTTLAELARCGSASAVIQLGATLDPGPASVLEQLGVPAIRLGWPIGVRASDALLEALCQLTGASLPESLRAERGRLIDSYVDAHKYVAGRRVAIVGDPDLAAALVGFCREIGMQPALVASGAASTRLATLAEAPTIEDADYEAVEERARGLDLDLILGPSKCYPMARRLGVPLVRVGFPIHDRIGAQRLTVFGYTGTQRLFDDIVNTLLAAVQDRGEVGYAYL